jgi:hypothetical protein
VTCDVRFSHVAICGGDGLDHYEFPI